MLIKMYFYQVTFLLIDTNYARHNLAFFSRAIEPSTVLAFETKMAKPKKVPVLEA